MGNPEPTQLLYCLGRQGNVAVFVAFPQAHMHLHAGAVDVSHLQACSFTNTQTAGINRTQAHPVMGTAQTSENLPHFLRA